MSKKYSYNPQVNYKNEQFGQYTITQNSKELIVFNNEHKQMVPAAFFLNKKDRKELCPCYSVPYTFERYHRMLNLLSQHIN